MTELKVLPALPEIAETAKRVPSRLWFIWLGGEMPAHAAKSLDMWRTAVTEHSGTPFSIMRVDDRAVQSFSLGPQIVSLGAELGLSHRAVADLMRVAIVYQYGGVYLDLDTIPLRLHWIDTFSPDAWIGGNRFEGSRTLTNAHFGMPAGHPFLKRVWELADAALARGNRNDHYVAGPRTWRKALNDFPDMSVPQAFPAITRGPLTRTFARAEDQDIDWLRWKWPNEALLHVIYSRAAVPLPNAEPTTDHREREERA